MQTQKAVTPYFPSLHLLPFGFAQQYKPATMMLYIHLKYTGDVCLLLKQYIRIYESTVSFHTDPGGHSDYYSGFTMALYMPNVS